MLGFALALSLTSCGGSSKVQAPSVSSAVPHLDHIIVVVMENKNYDQARTAPYTASLIASGSLFSNSYAVTHPSQPNYVALWSGSTAGLTDDACPAPGSPFTIENLGHACQTAGLTWRAYSGDLPSVASDTCTANSGSYTRKHDPWTNFANLDHQNERPYSDLAADIAAGTLPNLAFVVPSNCDNTHNCPVADGDAWLSTQLPPMLAAVGARGMVVLTWDEDDGYADNHVLTVFKGNPIKSGHVSDQRITHYTLLRTICDGLGLAPFGAAAHEAAITGVWN